jgi:hypothetical protein
MSTSTQSATYNAVLNAVGSVLVNGVLYNGVAIPGTGINGAYVQEAYMDYRPRSAEQYEITYGLLGESPFAYAGAGRLGHWTYVTLEVILYTRLIVDIAGSDFAWSRDLQLGALVMRQKIVDILQDNFLFLSYDPITFAPTDAPVTIEGLQQIPNPGPIKPAAGQSDRGKDKGGYGQHKLYFQVKMVQSLTTG